MLIGRGATSEVYALDHERAIKRVHADVERALAGARALLGFAHRNVVRIDEVGGDYIVMERVHGETLAARLLAGPLEEPVLRPLAAQIADGMAAVHARGIVHRDLKPANILVAGDVPKICDFGIAATTDHLTTASRIGTPAYMAPEQLTTGVVAPCVDIWAFGVILFELASGSLPFEGFDHGRCPQLVERAPAVTGVSSGLARLIARCLERDPSKRPASMAQIAGELRGDDVIDARVTQEVAPRGARRRWPIAVAAAIAIGVAAVVFERHPAALPPAAIAMPDESELVTPVIQTTRSVESPPVPAPPALPALPAPPAPIDRPRPRPRSARVTIQPQPTRRAGETLD